MHTRSSCPPEGHSLGFVQIAGDWELSRNVKLYVERDGGIWPSALAQFTMLSEYEKQRLRNIETNAQALEALGIGALIPERKKASQQPRQNKKRDREPAQPVRESRRARALPVPMYTPGQDEIIAAENRKSEIEQGTRMPDGLWSGERFGEVDGVAVGTVFGKGDYQRLGRQEMVTSGFHQPFVNPEWCAPGIGCYSIIFNNDNGSSMDDGDRIVYAGSGGRRRGQNRTAPQSFDQDWDNVTNAALRLNFETQQPVRLVRGPKLLSRHGTAESGGGYRYDGLYSVASAELVRSASGLRTAMFELRRIL